MARQTKDWKPGDKAVDSRDINALFAMLRKRLGMDGPFNLSDGAGGQGISFDEGLLSNICIAKTDAAYGLTYPTADSTPGAELWAFPIKLYPHAWFDCADSSPIVQEHIESGLGDVVYNVAHKHIPVDKFLIVAKINGVWWTYWTPATADDTITLGIYLDEDIAASAGPIDATIDGTATPIEVWDSQHLFPDAINGTKGRVVWELATSRWELVEVKRDAGGSTPATLRFRNNEGSDAPLHGILEVIEYDETDDVWEVCQPNYTDSSALTLPAANYLSKLYLINTGGVVASGAIGTGKFPQDTFDDAIEVLYDAVDTPVVGDCIGPHPDSWKGRLNAKGWHVLSINEDDETCRVFQNQLRSAKGTTVQVYSTQVGPFGAIGAWAIGAGEQDTRPILGMIDSAGTPGMGIAGHGRIQLISGARGATTASTSYAEASVPIEEPVYGAISDDLPTYFYTGTSLFNFTLGIIPDTDKLGPGLPGYICVDQEFLDDKRLALVIRDFTTSSWWAKVYSWNSSTGTLEAKPCLNQAGDYTYDGTGGMPALDPMSIQIDCDLTFRCPNIAVGDVIRYSFGPQRKNGTDNFGLYIDTLYLESNCYDDPLGTIKAWTGAHSIPRGWRRYTASDDLIITSYSSIGADRIPVQAGVGTTKHSYSFIWIERYQ